VASLIATSESPEIAAVISDGAFQTGKGVSEDISQHVLHDPKTNFLVRVLFLMSSVPGAARATALVYYLRSGVYLGPDLLSVMPSASRIRVPVLLISGQEDWIVPTDRARHILAVLPSDQKELLVIPGAHHDTTYSTAPELYGSTVLSFLDSAIKSN
jgi:pimeloyl-ACP methyl ester carboxylesterase